MKKIKIYAFLFLSIFIVFFCFTFVSGYFSERVEVYMSTKAENYCATLISDLLKEEVLNSLDQSELVTVNYKSENVVSSISVNTKIISSFLKSVNEKLVKSVEEIENASVDIPMGIILSDTLFGNLGPYLDVDIVMLSSFKADVFTELKEYGINSSLFEVFIGVTFTINTMIPLNSSLSVVDVKVPIVIQIINGEVPRYYYNTNDIIPDIYDN